MGQSNKPEGAQGTGEKPSPHAILEYMVSCGFELSDMRAEIDAMLGLEKVGLVDPKAETLKRVADALERIAAVLESGVLKVRDVGCVTELERLGPRIGGLKA